MNLERFAKIVEETERISEAAAGNVIILFSQMVGTLLLSRAVADVGPALADEILEEGRQRLLDAVDTQSPEFNRADTRADGSPMSFWAPESCHWIPARDRLLL